MEETNYNDSYHLIYDNNGFSEDIIPYNDLYPEEKVQYIHYDNSSIKRWYLVKVPDPVNNVIINICKHDKIMYKCKKCEDDRFWDSVKIEPSDSIDFEPFH